VSGIAARERTTTTGDCIPITDEKKKEKERLMQFCVGLNDAERKMRV